MENGTRRYFLELGGAMVLYLVVLVVSILLLQNGVVDGIARYAIAVTPMLPAIGALFAIARHFRLLDEMQRRLQLEALAFAFAGTAVLTFTYGFLEGVGFPHLNWTFVWPVMGAMWLAGRFVAGRRYH